MVVDVGGEYDPPRNRYDHHQRTFTTTFPNHGTKLSSAGLIYMHFGEAIIAQHTSLPIDHPNVELLHQKLYTDFIEAIDANDNGVSVYDAAALTNSGLQKRFRDTGVTLGSLIADFNFPDPTDPLQEEDVFFEKASTFIGDVFSRKLRHASQAWLPARAKVKVAYESRKSDAHLSGRIIVLSEGGVPWKEHLYNLENEASGGDEPHPNHQVYYVLYPESSTEGANWRVQCVPVSEGSFDSRKSLPTFWRGVRDNELDGVILKEGQQHPERPQIPPGAIFVHATGFIGGHKTKEGALAMAIWSLEA
jgi:uncharacterized UPF0160 family protein